jgi:uncharacterized membrane protein (UPF0127 family)
MTCHDVSMRRALIAFVALLSLMSCTEDDPTVAAPITSAVIRTADGAVRLRVETADTDAEREHGLMDRTSLGADEGMVFLFDSPSDGSFWMKNTLIPLDMIFIAADGTVRHVHANAVPLSTDAVPSGGPVRAVLEINGGSAALLGIKPGDKVKHPIFGN